MSSKTDLDESFELGKKSVQLVQDGKTGFMTTLNRTCNAPYSYELSSVPVCKVANKAKAVPINWINKEKNNVTEEMVAYLAPLVLGEVPIEYEAGIPKYLDISHLL